MKLTNNRSKPGIRTRPTFDFVSPHSLAKCVCLLGIHDGQLESEMGLLSKFRPPEYELVVETRRVNQDYYDFCLQWKLKKYRWTFPGKQPFVIAKGCLKQQKDQTQVVGKIRVVDFNGLVFSVWCLILILLVSLAGRSSVTFPLVLGLIIWGYGTVKHLLSLWRLQNRLVMILNSISEPPRHRV